MQIVFGRRGHAALAVPEIDAFFKAIRRLIGSVHRVEPRHQLAKREQHIVLDTLLRVASLPQGAHLHGERSRRVDAGIFSLSSLLCVADLQTRGRALVDVATHDRRLQRLQHLQHLGDRQALPLALMAEALALRREDELLEGAGHRRGPRCQGIRNPVSVNVAKVFLLLLLDAVDDGQRRAAGQRDENGDAQCVPVGRGRVLAPLHHARVEVALGQVEGV
eukprot:7390789-Prymnesium_polylepis.1